MSNYKTVFFTLGILQIILGVSMSIPIIIQIIYSELDSSFLGAGIITIIFGVLFFLSNLGHDIQLAEESIGGGQGVIIDRKKGILMGGSDSRKDGLAIGY